MKKSGILIVIITILVIVMSICLCSCDLFGGGKTDGPKPDENNNQPKDGWTAIASIEDKVVYQQFLNGFTDVAYKISKEEVQKKPVTLDGKAKISWNGNNFWLFVKGKYDSSSPREKTILSAEISTKEEPTAESKILALYVYKDELYINLGGNRVRFSLKNSKWTDYYPYSMKNYSASDLQKIAGVMAGCVNLNTPITGKKRIANGKEEYKYQIDIDLDKSLPMVVNSLSSMTKDEISIEELLAAILGVEVKQLIDGDIPQANLKMVFELSSKQISKLDAQLEIDLSETNSKLTDGDDLNAEINLEKLNITNDYVGGLTVDFVNDNEERSKYTSFSEAIYSFVVPMKLYQNDDAVATDYITKVTTRVFQEDSSTNYLFFEYFNKKENAVERAVYLYDGYLYIYGPNKNNERKFLHKSAVDLSDIASRTVSNSFNGKSKMDIYKLIGYVFNNTSITAEELRVLVTEKLFTDVWYNFYDMIDYLDAMTPDYDWKTENPDLLEFEKYMITNEILFTIEYSSEFIDILRPDDERITEIVNRLKNAQIEDITKDNTSDETLSHD